MSYLTQTARRRRIRGTAPTGAGPLIPSISQSRLTPVDNRRILREFREIDERLGNICRLDEEVAALCRRFDIDYAAEATPVPELICA